MLRLRDVMTTDVVTLHPDLTIREAMEIFTARHISGAPVLLGGRVLGVLSATDLISFASALPGVPMMREASEDLEDDAEPTAEDEEIASFTDAWEDAGAEVTERIASTDSPEWNFLEEHTVGEAMTRGARSLPPDTPVTTAADFMREHSIHRILVMHGDRLVGIVSAMDIVTAVADRRVNGGERHAARPRTTEPRQPPV